MQDFSCPSSNIVADGSVHMHGSHTYPDDEIEEQRQRDSRQSAIRHPMTDRWIAARTHKSAGGAPRLCKGMGENDLVETGRYGHHPTRDGDRRERGRGGKWAM